MKVVMAKDVLEIVSVQNAQGDMLTEWQDTVVIQTNNLSPTPSDP